MCPHGIEIKSHLFHHPPATRLRIRIVRGVEPGLGSRKSATLGCCNPSWVPRIPPSQPAHPCNRCQGEPTKKNAAAASNAKALELILSAHYHPASPPPASKKLYTPALVDTYREQACTLYLFRRVLPGKGVLQEISRFGPSISALQNGVYGVTLLRRVISHSPRHEPFTSHPDRQLGPCELLRVFTCQGEEEQTLILARCAKVPSIFSPLAPKFVVRTHQPPEGRQCRNTTTTNEVKKILRWR